MKDFNDRESTAYDEKVHASVPGYRLAHEAVYAYLKERVPSGGDILVVGAGTGYETRNLAEINPSWKITGLEPALEMFRFAAKICDNKNVSLVNVKLEDFQSAQLFDSATALLVSQFLPDNGEKTAFFKKVGSLIKPGGVFAIFDVFEDESSFAQRGEGFESWRSWMSLGSLPPENIRLICKRFPTLISPITEERLDEILLQSGFSDKTLIFKFFNFSCFILRKEYV